MKALDIAQWPPRRKVTLICMYALYQAAKKGTLSKAPYGLAPEAMPIVRLIMSNGYRPPTEEIRGFVESQIDEDILVGNADEYVRLIEGVLEEKI